MKAILIIFLAINACHCQQRCSNQEDISRIIETPPKYQDLKPLVESAEKESYSLNQTLSQYKPDQYPEDPIPIQCSAAIIGNIFADIDTFHVDDDKWELSETTYRDYLSLEKSMYESTDSRVKRGIFGFFKKVVKGIVKIAQTIAKVVQVIKNVVSFVLTVLAIIKDIKAIFGFFG
ncbi:hypothetical protein HA402_013424 [Bradysia odoriphaga]|nr:hypothetical protein HA402_013424 [Bradysia odoriphaga]